MGNWQILRAEGDILGPTKVTTSDPFPFRLPEILTLARTRTPKVCKMIAKTLQKKAQQAVVLHTFGAQA